ncbi:hypothetical protein BCR34DRAFT_601834 [Clohesyomyces aquaticus]|uniref:Uncharacterized protein n=1 Tax=Clohesyomyces aquaticus TaxID=1231657 RepID=A0A1Y1ZKN3_9PLEO|nr:hypothetical protein BCR34DRAFT_601834 [Clohesyomyces aquaticus]
MHINLLAFPATLMGAAVATPIQDPAAAGLTTNSTALSERMIHGICGAHIISKDMCGDSGVEYWVTIRSFEYADGTKWVKHPVFGHNTCDWDTDTGYLLATRAGERVKFEFYTDGHGIASSWNSNDAEGHFGHCGVGDWTTGPIDGCPAADRYQGMDCQFIC